MNERTNRQTYAYYKFGATALTIRGQNLKFFMLPLLYAVLVRMIYDQVIQ